MTTADRRSGPRPPTQPAQRTATDGEIALRRMMDAIAQTRVKMLVGDGPDCCTLSRQHLYGIADPNRPLLASSAVLRAGARTLRRRAAELLAAAEDAERVADVEDEQNSMEVVNAAASSG
jgi:hypothetical protein